MTDSDRIAALEVQVARLTLKAGELQLENARLRRAAILAPAFDTGIALTTRDEAPHLPHNPFNAFGAVY